MHEIDVPQELIGPMCGAVQHLMTSNVDWEIEDVLRVVQTTVHHMPDADLLVNTSLMRLILGIAYALIDNEDGGFDEFVVHHFDMKGGIQQVLSMSYLRAALLVPVKYAQSDKGQEIVTIEPAVLLDLARQIDSAGTTHDPRRLLH